MIVVTAKRLDAYGHFEFRIEVDGKHHTATRDALKAAKVLAKLGVETPFGLVDHARTWGSLEIIQPRPPNSGQ